MPAYNAVDYIMEAIESVLIQNYRNFELLIINDGSTDNTEEIVLGFKDERIRYYHQENRGLAATHNVGIKQSRGEFIIKLDCDDMMVPDFIAKHLQEFEKHPEADLIYCDDCLIDEDSKPIRVIERPEYTDRKLLIRDLFRGGFPVVPFRTCIRRSVFDKIGFFDEELLVGEDYDMMRRFTKQALKAHHLKAPLYIRRMTRDSLSRRKPSSRKVEVHFELMRRFTETFSCDELFPDVEWDKIAPERRQLHAKCLAAVTYLAIGQHYVELNSLPIYAKMAFGQACSELSDCLKIDPNNHRIQQLLHKCELGQQKYDEKIQQAVC
jgi:glycosyltransferase involved in cell wall biosynthesis